MRTIIATLALLLLTPIAWAGSASAVIAFEYNADVPVVRIQVPADFVAMPINIQNDLDDPVKRADEIEKAVRVITERIKQNSDMSVVIGVVSLSPRQQSKFGSFSSGYERGSSVQLYVLGTLKQNANVFAVTKRLLQTVSAIAVPDKTKVTLGNATLGIYEPEKYRSQILGAIAKSITETKKSLGISGLVGVEGLENPVSVMQFNEKDTIIFINYKLKIQSKGS